MTGLATDILVQFFSAEDTEQRRKAVELMSALTSDEAGWIGWVVLLDLVWELRHNYKLNRTEIDLILDKLLSSNEIVIEKSEIVQKALTLYRIGKADFPDYLIAVSAEAAGCARTVTFDRIAARDAGMELLS